MESLCTIKKVLSAIYDLEGTLKRQFHLTLNETLCMCSLENGEQSPGNLAEDLGVSLSRMSRVLSSLERKGMVQRSISEVDKRKMLFTLTPEGEARLQAVKATELSIPEVSLK